MQSKSTIKEVSITRALTELKTIDSRIQKAIESGVFVSYSGQFHKPTQGVDNSKSVYQSITDLITYRTKLKSAIITSNASTRVTICNMNMTVAEAIEMKSSLKHRKSLLTTLKRQYASATSEVENINSRVRRELEAKTKLSDTTDKTMSVEAFSEKYMQMHGVEVYDPLGVTKKIEELGSLIEEFESQVDCILSEKNATTMILIE